MFRVFVLVILACSALVIGRLDGRVDAADAPRYTYPFFQTFSLTCGFGCYGGHVGTDYQLGNSAAGGEYVVAAMGGTAAYFEDFVNRYGKFIVIDHGNGDETRYLHLQNQAVSYGPAVSTGQLVGLEGNTGGPWCQDPPACNNWQSPYHLHFETRQSGTAVDPYGATTYMWTTNPPSYAEGETIGVSSWASNRIDVFVRGNNGQLRHRWWDSGQWHPVGS